MEITALKATSISVAAENKPLTATTLNVYPLELVPAGDGYLGVNPVQVETTGTKYDGTEYTSSVQSDNVITAEWLPYGSNRVTPPDIRRGERVMLYRVGDTDQYYWSDLGLDASLRRLETVIYAFNANPSIKTSGFDPSNCYYLEVSTHNKTFTLGTSKANGEPYAYTLQLNAADGNFTFTDDIGNFVHLDSKDKRIILKNAAESFFDMFGKNLSISVLDNIDIKAGKRIDVTAGTDATLTVGKSLTETVGTETKRTTGTSLDTTVGTTTSVTTGTAYTLNAGTLITETALTGFNVTAGECTVTSNQGPLALTSTGPMVITAAGPYTVIASNILMTAPSMVHVGKTLGSMGDIKAAGDVQKNSPPM